jgi:hypothetical protein
MEAEMKGMITSTGKLAIERRSGMRAQGCPMGDHNAHPGYGYTRCGDWCPLFGEPQQVPVYKMKFMDIVVDDSKPMQTEIELCKRTLTFTEFSDEREGK